MMPPTGGDITNRSARLEVSSDPVIAWCTHNPNYLFKTRPSFGCWWRLPTKAHGPWKYWPYNLTYHNFVADNHVPQQMWRFFYKIKKTLAHLSIKSEIHWVRLTKLPRCFMCWFFISLNLTLTYDMYRWNTDCKLNLLIFKLPYRVFQGFS